MREVNAGAARSQVLPNLLPPIASDRASFASTKRSRLSSQHYPNSFSQNAKDPFPFQSSAC